MKYDCELVGCIRVRDGLPYIKYVLEQFSRIKQMSKVVVFDDHSTDGTIKLAKKYSKVHLVNSPFPKDDLNEARDRNFTMNEAKKFNPVWIATLDADEIFEEPKIYDIIDDLLHPDNPQKLCYIFPLFNLWDSPNQWRGDGVYSQFIQGRFYKNLPNQTIGSPGDDKTTLSGCVPWFSYFNTKIVFCRIKHYGTLEKEIREKKCEFYKKLYREKGVTPLALGNWEPYYKQLYKKEKLDPEDFARHIAGEEGIQLYKWPDRASISLNVCTKNNETELTQLLGLLKPILDEIVIVDSGSTDKTLQVAESFGAKIIKTEWKNDYSYVRNLGIENSTCETILRLDPDETVSQEELIRIWYMACAGNIDAYIFPVKNFIENPAVDKNAKWFHSQSIRMFKRQPGIKYTGLVHEEIDKSLKDIVGKPVVAMSPVCIAHFGYLNPKEYMEAKFDYYYKLCLKEIKANPNNFYHYHSVGVHMKHIEKFKEAKEYFNKSLELEPRAFLSYSGLGEIAEKEGDFDLAADYYRKAYEVKNPLKIQSLETGYFRKIYEMKSKKALEGIKTEMEEELKKKEEPKPPEGKLVKESELKNIK